MDKKILGAGLIFMLVVFWAHGCGQTQSSTATSAGGGTSQTTTVSGQILVPSSSVTTLSLAGVKLRATAADGVSDTPLSGASVIACDPITGFQLTGTATATAGTDGTFALNIPNSVLPSGEVLFKASKSSGANTAIVKCFGLPAETVAINAGTTMIAAKLMQEMSKKAGDLFSKAASLPSDNKTELKNLIETMSAQAKSIIGTIEAANIPTLVYTNTGKTFGELEKLQFEQVSSEVDAEFSHSGVSLNTWNTNLNSFYTAATNLVVLASYEAGLELPVSYEGFVIPSGFQFPAGAKFGYSPMGENFIPSGLLDNLPSGAQFESGFTLPAGATLPAGLILGSGFSLPAGYKDKLPSDVYMYDGVGLPAGTIMPQRASFEAGFTMPADIQFASGFTMPKNVSFEAGFSMPKNVSFEAGFSMPKNVSFEAGFTIPTNVSFEAGFTMPKNVSFEAGFVPPQNMQYEQGWQAPGGWTPPTGWAPPTWEAQLPPQQPPPPQ